MTNMGLHTEFNKRWLKIAQFALFVFALIAWSVLCFFYRTVEIKRPLILLAASVFALFNFKKVSELCLIQKIALLYIIEMQFNQLSLQFVHIQSASRDISVSLALIVLAPLSAAFVCKRLHEGKTFNVETNDMLKSWAVVFAIIMSHMLFLFLLLKNFYGYGYEHTPNVLANMCLYFPVFLFSWDQLANIHLRRIAAIVLTAFFVAMIIIKGL